MISAKHSACLVRFLRTIYFPSDQEAKDRFQIEEVPSGSSLLKDSKAIPYLGTTCYLQYIHYFILPSSGVFLLEVSTPSMR